MNSQLPAASAGTAEHNANKVLNSAGQADLKSALTAVTAIAETAAKLKDNGAKPLPATSPDITALSILADLVLLPQKVAALDAQGAHNVAGDLNNQFSPLVKMAADVDLTWISQVLSVLPDPTGYAQLAALVASILANVDVVKLANLVGQIQEIAWDAVEELLPPPGQLPDARGAAAAMAELVPAGLELASVAVKMLSGKATTTSPALLGSPTAAATLPTREQNEDLLTIAKSLTKMDNAQSGTDLASLVAEGLDAKSFLASGAHQSYNSLVVDNTGRNAIQWIGDWRNLQINRAT